MKKAMPRAVEINVNELIAELCFTPMSFREQGKLWLAALSGEDNIFSKHMRPYRRRQPTGWRETRQRIFERDEFRCTYCGATDSPLECDHVVPVRWWGSNDDDNLTTACAPCNRSKKDRSVEEWR